MFTNGCITHYEKKNQYKRNTYDAYVEKGSSDNHSKEGKTKNYSLFVAIQTTEKLPILEGDLIVVGDCKTNIDTSSEKAESTSYRELTNMFETYIVKSVEPCLIGSKRMWHYELGCD